MQARLRTTQAILKNPGGFALRVIGGFRANQGLLLSGAVAYYTLLSIIPLLALVLVALSHVIDEAQLVATLRQYLNLVVPGESEAVVRQLVDFLAHREVVGWVVVAVLLFFSSMAFTVLENAMSVIFFHRVAIQRRHFLISALLPYVFILVLGVGFLLVTLIAGALQTLQQTEFGLFGATWSFGGLSVALLYLIGLGGEILLLTSIYLVMPVGRLSWRRALLGGVTAGLLWELTRHVLVWYFSSLSFVNVVYGSLATTIVVLLSLEVAAMILLLGAQVIAEYERYSDERKRNAPPEPMHTDHDHGP
ncbi:MAG: YihY/virulence factor BrkB family protein [Pseudomonadota bacterium]|nr:YihY/virulence factor BrkB family protein [Pseudomonadota bacterium]